MLSDRKANQLQGLRHRLEARRLLCIIERYQTARSLSRIPPTEWNKSKIIRSPLDARYQSDIARGYVTSRKEISHKFRYEIERGPVPHRHERWPVVASKTCRKKKKFEENLADLSHRPKIEREMWLFGQPLQNFKRNEVVKELGKIPDQVEKPWSRSCRWY